MKYRLNRGIRKPCDQFGSVSPQMDQALDLGAKEKTEQSRQDEDLHEAVRPESRSTPDPAPTNRHPVPGSVKSQPLSHTPAFPSELVQPGETLCHKSISAKFRSYTKPKP